MNYGTQSVYTILNEQKKQIMIVKLSHKCLAQNVLDWSQLNITKQATWFIFKQKTQKYGTAY